MDTPLTPISSFLALQDKVSPDLKRKYVPRATQACQMCRRKKSKCDQGRPVCSICKDRGYDCTYTDGNSKSRRKEGPGQNAQQNHRDEVSVSIADSNDYNSTTPRSPHRSWRGARRKESDSDAASQGATAWLQRSGIDHSLRGQEMAPGVDADILSGTDQASSVISPGHRHDYPSELDPVGDVNNHTSGMEFYGTSSNFALLSQLLSKARSRPSVPSYGDRSHGLGGQMSHNWSSIRTGGKEQTTARSSTTPNHSTNDETPKALKENPVSIVNLLFDEDSAVQDSAPPSRVDTPPHREGADRINSTTRYPGGLSKAPQLGDLEHDKRTQANPSSRRAENGHERQSKAVINEITEIRRVENQLEKEYIRIFFDNLHYIHPFLCPTAFTSRCEREVWENMDYPHLQKHQLHFFALYNAVVAVGALTAGTDLLTSLRFRLGTKSSRKSTNHDPVVPSSVGLSKIYFGRAKKFLGDYFEVCSLESVQALILMSLYCQNALKPHACYMYSGMAVRTALAIGLPDECMSETRVASDEAKKTWWAIYSQEVDMCCSSGRRSSLMEPQEYRISLPEVENVSGNVAADGATSPTAMIPEMVGFASVLLRTSCRIYHNAKDVSLQERSRIAHDLDKELLLWRSNLPPWLNSRSHPFREPEWAGKQRLVLQLRFYNAKILIHRPLMASSNTQSFPELELHTAACLDGARKTIELLYESYTHRHYFRTWYYNSTYTLYASMIILYVILTKYPHVPNVELIRDVEKSLDVLHAMDNVKVAQRCANLIREVLEVVQRQLKTNQATNVRRDDTAEIVVDSVYGREGACSSGDWIELGSNTMPIPPQGNQNSQDSFSAPQHFTASTGTTRNNLLASIMDPVALEGFASDMSLTQVLDTSMDWAGMVSETWMDFTPSSNLSINGYYESGLFYGAECPGFQDIGS